MILMFVREASQIQGRRSANPAQGEQSTPKKKRGIEQPQICKSKLIAGVTCTSISLCASCRNISCDYINMEQSQQHAYVPKRTRGDVVWYVRSIENVARTLEDVI
jgi:hypothetical protein